jgi:tetratricopeptide (TPR) repeat protein
LDKAEALGSTDSHAHAIRGFIHLYQWDWESAHDEFQAALMGEPDNSDLLQWHSQFLSGLGYIDRGLDQARKSVEADPLSPVAHQRLGVMFLWHGDLDSAEEQLRIATEELGLAATANPRITIGLMLKLGRYEELRAAGEAILSIADSPIDWLAPWLDYLSGAGPAGPALDALGAAYDSGTLAGRRYVAALYYLDDADVLFDAIDRVQAAGSQMDHEIWFVNEGHVLQADPRFPELLGRFGIIDYWDAHEWPAGCGWEGDLIRCKRASEAEVSLTDGDQPES